VIVRHATAQDEAGLRILWEAFEAEVPEPPGFLPELWEEQWSAICKSIGDGAVYVAQDGNALVAVVHVRGPERGVAHVEWAHVHEGWRRRGLVKGLLRECVREVKSKGATTVSLEASRANEIALTVWRRFGFEVVEFFMATPLDQLEIRLADPAAYGETDSVEAPLAPTERL
jgi:ribosomal protein S18 acetylase RimI-like enzyme